MAILYDIAGEPVQVPEEYIDIFLDKLKNISDELLIDGQGYLKSLLSLRVKSTIQSTNWVKLSDKNASRAYFAIVSSGIFPVEIGHGVAGSEIFLRSINKGESYKYTGTDSVFIKSPAIADLRYYEINYLSSSFENKLIDVINTGGGETATLKHKVFILSGGETSFSLDVLSTQPQKTQVYLNGQLQRFSVDFNINGLVLNWFGIPLKVNWEFQVFYY